MTSESKQKGTIRRGRPPFVLVLVLVLGRSIRERERERERARRRTMPIRALLFRRAQCSELVPGTGAPPRGMSSGVLSLVNVRSENRVSRGDPATESTPFTQRAVWVPRETSP